MLNKCARVCTALLVSVGAGLFGLSGRAAALDVGGHVGVALPIVTVSHDTTTFVDQTVIATPMGLGLKITDKLTLDFESIVLSPVTHGGTTTLIIDPGLVYKVGPLALGLRVARKINEHTNIGVIPLVNVPLIKMEHTTWFVEAAFPTFYASHRGSFTSVLHTGLGF